MRPAWPNSLPAVDSIQFTLLSSPGVLVRSTGGGSVTGDLRSVVMCAGQCGGECDSAARDLSTGSVRVRERRDKIDGGAASAEADGGNNRRLLIAAGVNGDGLAIAKSNRVGDGDNNP